MCHEENYSVRESAMDYGEPSIVGFVETGETANLDLLLVLDSLGSIILELRGSDSEPSPNGGAQTVVRTRTDKRRILTY